MVSHIFKVKGSLGDKDTTLPEYISFLLVSFCYRIEHCTVFKNTAQSDLGMVRRSQILGLCWAAAWRTKLPAVSRFSSKKCTASITMRLVTHQPAQKTDYIKSLFPQMMPPLQMAPPGLVKSRFNFAIVLY